ncbi:unnamed protein product [Phyllotreta striolata]|uniref:Aldehyde dehydrogenase domain-containing protein n=1 Tax=Phyllotreta striolata TaxID=444603 RepID=A0A9N9TK85_PHYSR|nr:unnamed protein product [Phyllotreta striolata]
MAARSKIPEIFDNMDYGESEESVEEALEWITSKGNKFFTSIENPNEPPPDRDLYKLKRFNYDPLCTVYESNIDDITKIIETTDVECWIQQKSLSKMLILNRISKAIEKNANLIVQLELLFREILAKDSKNTIPLLSNYFRYYSAFADQSGEGGIAVGVVPDSTYLPYLGLFIAPALARGYSIVLQILPDLAPIAFLLKDIAKSAGVPENAFKIIPSYGGNLQPYLNSEKVKIISIFEEANNGIYGEVNGLHKNILILSKYKTPTIIFDSADLDSACESVIESSWGYRGWLPWSTDTILVQENVLETFYNKLKSKLAGLKVSNALDKSSDITLKNRLNSLDKLVKEAQQQGIEVFRSKNEEEWCPTVFKGGKVKTNNVFKTDYDVFKARAVTVLAFRSIDEAVALANNTKQGLWASVWSENIGLVNEVTKKLKVSNVLVNTNNVPLAPDVVISPIKDSGMGNFGGTDGFNEYKFSDLVKPEALVENPTTIPSINSIVSAAKAAQESWEKVPRIQKQKILLEFVELNTDWSELDAFVRAFSRATIDKPRSTTISGYQLTSSREPRGIVVVCNNAKWCAESILTTLYEGNALILLEADDTRRKVFERLKQLLPKGVLNLLPYSGSIIEKLSANKQVSVILGCRFDGVLKGSLKESMIFRRICVDNSHLDCGRYATYTKNVWSDIGKSSTCNFS